MHENHPRRKEVTFITTLLIVSINRQVTLTFFQIFRILIYTNFPVDLLSILAISSPLELNFGDDITFLILFSSL